MPFGRSGTAILPLHGGKAPAWLFQRMKALAREVSLAIIAEFGTTGFLERISDPFWFQCLGSTLGFDWHSSGLTTTLAGAIKEGLKGLEEETGLYLAGGKGGRARKTPLEIRTAGEKTGVDPEGLIYASRLSARVDNNALQDGFHLYHHSFFFDTEGNWAVIQQGMNETSRLARRYHWLGTEVQDFMVEPHRAICSELRGTALNLVKKESAGVRTLLAELAGRAPEKNIRDLNRLLGGGGLFPELLMPGRHRIKGVDIDPSRIHRILIRTYQNPPGNFEALIGMEGVGPATIRALSMIAELIYGEKPSFRDPARFSFAVGGKDGIPYPVNRKVYDRTIEIMKRALERARVGQREKLEAVRRLMRYSQPGSGMG